MSTADVRLQVRYDVASAWAEANPVLRAGELGVETDESRAKIGDGQRAWNELPYVGSNLPHRVDGGAFQGNA